MSHTQKIVDLIKQSNLGYLHTAKLQPYTTKTEIKNATTHGADLSDGFCSCLGGSVDIPAGTEGLLYVRQVFEYSDWEYVGDEWRPTENATRTVKKTYWQFLTVVTLPSGHEVLAESFKSVEKK